MKSLTIWQPWASLIMIGAKPWEWRGWPLPKWMIDQQVVIHAGARPVRRSEVEDIYDDLLERPGETSLVVHKATDLIYGQIHRFMCGQKSDLPLSCGLGTVILRAPASASDWAAEHDKSGLDSDRIDHSKWAWPITDIKPFAQPIPCRGAQGFWNWPEAGQEP